MRQVLLCFLIWFLTGAGAQAQCIQALIQDRKKLNLRESSSLAAMRLLQQSSTKKSGWSLEATVPIEGIPVNFGAKGNEAKTNQYFENSKTNWTNERLISVATQELSRNAVEAYKTCIGAIRQTGPRIIVHDAKSDAVTVEVRWNAPPFAPPEQQGRVTVANGQGNPFPQRWTTGMSVREVIKRTPGTDLRIVANIGGDSDSEFVSFLPAVDDSPPPPPFKSVQLFSGLAPNINLSELSTNPQHKNAPTQPWGFTVREDDFRAGDQLFVGVTPNVNAGIVSTRSDFRGGAGSSVGWVIGRAETGSDKPVYASTADAGRCLGVVGDNLAHQNCPMKLIGYTVFGR